MRDKLIELLKNAIADVTYYSSDGEPVSTIPFGVVENGYEKWLADYLIAKGVTIANDNCVGDKKPLTIAERADLDRIRISIERKYLDMAQPGMWERYTKNMECGEIREFAQYYRDMELVYRVITGHELPWPPKEDNA